MKILSKNIGKFIFAIICCIALIFLFYVSYQKEEVFTVSDKLSEKPLENILEIKMFLYEKIIQDNVDTGINYKKIEYRFMREPDFDYIAPKLEEKFPGVKIFHGKRNLMKIGETLEPEKVDDGLDYEESYMDENHVFFHQLGEIILSDDGQEIQVEQVESRHPRTRYCYIHIFRKEGKHWFYYGISEMTFSSIFNDETRYFEALAAL